MRKGAWAVFNMLEGGQAGFDMRSLPVMVIVSEAVAVYVLVP